jgi:DNA-binding phage protein
MKGQVVKVDFKAIRDHAKANRWGVTKIAESSGLTRTTIYSILGGKTDPSAATLKKVCDVIGFPIEDAFTQAKRKAAA